MKEQNYICCPKCHCRMFQTQPVIIIKKPENIEIMKQLGYEDEFFCNDCGSILSITQSRVAFIRNGLRPKCQTIETLEKISNQLKEEKL